MYNAIFSRLGLVLLTMIVGLTACKREFDNPPAFIEPNITATHTIAQLRAMYPGTGYYTINDDVIVAGVVAADDKSGNLYKTIMVQDATGGISVLLNGNNLYADYPIGRKLYIKCKGLILGNYARMIQLGGFIDNSDPASPQLGEIQLTQFNTVLVKGSLGNPVTPRVVTIGQLNESFQSTLVQLDLMNFISADVNQPYADAVNRISVNRTLADISGGTIIVRTSGYARFASDLTSPGTGTVLAMYTQFNNTKQLLIRDTTDVRLRSGSARVYFDENFESITTGSTFALAGWTNVAETGTVLYRGAIFSNNKYAEVSAFNSGQAVVKSWLVSPAINVSAITEPNKALLFKTKDAFNNGATLKVFVSTDYTGSATPWTSTWTQIPAIVASGQTTGFAPNFTGSGAVSLAGYTGNIRVAFVYEAADPAGTGSDRTTTYQIDDVRTIGY